MAENVGSIAYDARIETAQLKKDASEVERISHNAGNSMGDAHEKGAGRAGQAFKKFGQIATVAIATTGVALGAFVVNSIKSASDLEETTNKVAVAFGENAKEVMKWGNTTLKSMGMAKQTALDLASTFGDMGTAMGLNTKEASDMAMSVTQLAGDMASFKNINVDVAQTALKGIWTGEGEALKSLGVIMQETTLKEYAVAKGMKKAYTEMTQAEKVQLRYNYVMEATKNSQGDFARTSGGMANQLRMVGENFKEISTTIGAIFLPFATKVVSTVNDMFKSFGSAEDITKKLNSIFATVGKTMQPVFENIGKIAKEVSDYLIPKFMALWTALTGTVMPAMQNLYNSILVPLGQMFGTVLVIGIGLVTDALTFLAQGFTFWAPILAGAVIGMMAWNASLIVSGATTGLWTTITGLATSAQIAWNVALLANPIGLVIALVAGLVAGIAVLIGVTSSQTGADDAGAQAKDRLKQATSNLNKVTQDQIGLTTGAESARIAEARALERKIALEQQGITSGLDYEEAVNNLAIATDNHDKALAREKTGMDNVKKAQDEQKASTKAVEDYEKRKQNAVNNTNLKLDNQITKLGTLNSSLDNLNGRQFTYTISGVQNGAKPPANRALGGSVSANTPYFVGENRDGSLNKTSELFVPRSAGTIINSSDLQRALRGGSGNGGGSTVIENNIQNINVASDVDADKLLNRLGLNQETVSSGLQPLRSFA